MARCVHPGYRTYLDPYSSEVRRIAIPCGKCCNCLANEQDSWSIRIQETASHYDSFIYETLTFNNGALSRSLQVDLSDLSSDAFDKLSSDSFSLLSYWSAVLGSVSLPLFRKDILSAWIKRGRENYFADTGKRLQLKYLFVMEYGPIHSRPHAHGLLFGITLSDYKKYFGDPWRKDFGFVYTKEVRKLVNSNKDVQCISRYVSKYVNKGLFESPLVKDGLLPKAWKVCSNGIGAEYLTSSRFSFLGSSSVYSDSAFFGSWDSRTQVPGLPTGCMETVRHWRDGSYSFNRRLRNAMRVKNDPLGYLGFSQSDLSKFCSYVDQSGFYHRLPRYYSDRLLGRTPSLFKYAVQTALLANAEQRRYQELSRLASNIERSRACQKRAKDYGLELSVCAYYMALYVSASVSQNVAEREAARHFSTMKNHYLRPKRARSSVIQLNQ